MAPSMTPRLNNVAADAGGLLRHAIEELPVDPLSIYEVVVVGN
jgi:hypothetical protein